MNRILTCSSITFLIPAVLASVYYQPFFAVVSVITSIVSVNYWRNPVPGIRKTTDLVVAKLSFSLYFSALVVKLQWNSLYCLCLCTNTTLLVLCYALSCWLFDLSPPQNKNWVYFHFCFHLLVTINQCMVIVLYL
jgi:hypothetical protein